MTDGPLLFIFVDGVGLAQAGPRNPLTAAPGAGLGRLIQGSLVEGAVPRSGVLLRALDATLGVAGLPQSATGQTALLTGVNAAARLGRHVTAFPGARLQRILQRSSVIRRLSQAGLRCTFANAFHLDPYERSERGRLSATTRAMMAAELPFRRLPDLESGRAVTWDVCRDRWLRGSSGGLSPIVPEEAGRHLASIVSSHDFTLYETFMTDLAGHRRFDWIAREALRRLDGLLAGLLEALPTAATVLLTSDHGNLEDAESTLHTRNPVPLLVWGRDREAFAGAGAISDVAPAILEALGVH